MRCRLAVSGVIGFLPGMVCYRYQWALGNGGAWDFTWALRAAAELLAGAGPYRVPAHANAIPYPLPAAFVALPFIFLSPAVAAACVIGGSSALLAFGLTRDQQWWRLFVFLALPYWQSTMVVQWAPLLFAVALYPALLPVTLCKPTLGAAVALPRLTSGRAASMLVVGLLSVVVRPDWPLRWLDQANSYGGFLPLLTLPGVLLLLACANGARQQRKHCLRWLLRPSAYGMYDQLLVFLIPGTARSLLLLVAGSWLGYLLTPFAGPPAVVACLYLPALAMVLQPSSPMHWKTMPFRRTA